MKRHPDGKWRNARHPMKLSTMIFRSRFIEGETVHLKRLGLSLDAIADRLTQIGRGSAQPMTSRHPLVTFPPNFKISRQGCHKALKRALAREPALEVKELRQIDTDRCEDLYKNLQLGIQKGNPGSIRSGVKVLEHKAKINGYLAPRRYEVTGKDGAPLALLELLAAIGPLDDQGKKNED